MTTAIAVSNVVLLGAMLHRFVPFRSSDADSLPRLQATDATVGM